MIELLHTLGIPGLLALFAAMVLLTIQVLKKLINIKSKEAAKLNIKLHPLDKKIAEVDVNRYRGIVANIGLALSIAIVLSAFEYPDFEEKQLVKIGHLILTPPDTMMVFITEHEPPPKPVVKAPKIEAVEEEPELEIVMDFGEPNESDLLTEVLQEEISEEKEEATDIVHTIVQESAAPVGGFQAFYKFVKNNIKYPKQAKRMGVEGRVYLQFVVDKDGSITEVKVIRGIGAGCDEEAKRVLDDAPKWNPGKQRGRPVKQRIVIPILFRFG